MSTGRSWSSITLTHRLDPEMMGSMGSGRFALLRIHGAPIETTNLEIDRKPDGKAERGDDDTNILKLTALNTPGQA